MCLFCMHCLFVCLFVCLSTHTLTPSLSILTGASTLPVQEAINDAGDAKSEITIQTQPFKSPEEQSELGKLS